jgi:hypothetical protein
VFYILFLDSALFLVDVIIIIIRLDHQHLRCTPSSLQYSILLRKLCLPIQNIRGSTDMFTTCLQQQSQHHL